jgi:phosphohistidine phosphatase
MELYFLRHGIAGQRTEWRGDDSERPLSDAGREDMARIATAIAKLGLALDAIITSPYARAFQTADIVAQHLNMRDKLVKEDRLAPGFDIQRLAKLLKAYPDAGALMLVGHEPDLSSVVSELVGGRIVFKKGGMAYVRLADLSLKKAELVWLVQPALLGL